MLHGLRVADVSADATADVPCMLSILKVGAHNLLVLLHEDHASLHQDLVLDLQAHLRSHLQCCAIVHNVTPERSLPSWEAECAVVGDVVQHLGPQQLLC